MTTPDYSPPTDLASTAVSLLLPSLSGPVMMALTRAAASLVADTFAAATRILDVVERGPSGSTGAGLDRWGGIIGEPRSGRGDPEYSGAIATQLQIQRSRGTLDELRAILRQLTAPGQPVTWAVTPGAVTLEARRDSPIPLPALQRQAVRADLESAAPASVRIDPIVDARPTSFTFDVPTLGFDRGVLAESF